jgi:hypothetical protein
VSVADSFKNLPPWAKVVLPVSGVTAAFIVYKKRKAASAAANPATIAAAGMPTSANLGAGIDPATGVPYAQEESAYYNQGSPTAGGSSFDPFQFYGPNGPTGSTPAPTPVPTQSAPTTPPAASGPSVPAALSGFQYISDPRIGSIDSATPNDVVYALENGGKTLVPVVLGDPKTGGDRLPAWYTMPKGSQLFNLP